MKRVIPLLTIAGMTLLGLVAVGGPVGAVVSGRNGRIAFARCFAPFKCGSTTVANWKIVAADPDGSNETVLAGPYARDAFDDHFIANWAPDGSSVIFMANQRIWQVNADGSGLHRVFKPPPELALMTGRPLLPTGSTSSSPGAVPRASAIPSG